MTIAIADTGILPADLFTTRALLHHPERAPDLQAEIAAFCEISRTLVQDPGAALRRFLQIALRLCKAGTAGLSLLRSNEAGQPTVHWEAVGGALASQEGVDTPRDFSPCGLCLDQGVTVVVSRPERVFTYLRDTQPAIVEDLIVPLYDKAGRALGTFWIAHHDSTSRFCSDDARIVEQLATQVVLALELLEQAREHRHALALIQSHETAQRTLTYDLAEERRRRELAEAAENGIRQALVFKETAIREAHHRVKNTIQIASSLLSLQARASLSTQVREALQQGHGRLNLLAKAHELLYLTPGCTREILMPKLLQTIADALQQSFAEMSARVKLQVISDTIMLAPDDAIPLALLANEALTNAHKYAFPDSTSGEITVSLRGTPADTMVLRITDNGIGMGSSEHQSGLGLKLIRGFAAQLHGTLTIATPVAGSGTQITLTVDRKAQREHEPLEFGRLDVGSIRKPVRPGMLADQRSNLLQ